MLTYSYSICDWCPLSLCDLTTLSKIRSCVHCWITYITYLRYSVFVVIHSTKDSTLVSPSHAHSHVATCLFVATSLWISGAIANLTPMCVVVERLISECLYFRRLTPTRSWMLSTTNTGAIRDGMAVTKASSRDHNSTSVVAVLLLRNWPRRRCFEKICQQTSCSRPTRQIVGWRSWHRSFSLSRARRDRHSRSSTRVSIDNGYQTKFFVWLLSDAIGVQLQSVSKIQRSSTMFHSRLCTELIRELTPYAWVCCNPICASLSLKRSVIPVYSHIVFLCLSVICVHCGKTENSVINEFIPATYWIVSGWCA